PAGIKSGGTLGIIAGSGGLPRRLIDACRHKGRDVFVLALEGEADAEAVGCATPSWWRIRAAAQAPRLLRTHGGTRVVYAGGVRRPTLAAIRPDWRAAKFFAKVGYRLLGDDGLFSAIAKEMELEGFRVVGAHELLDESVAVPEGPLGRVKPDAE